MKVDLRNCEQGDILISKHGAILEYLEPLPKENYYDHSVKYLWLDGELNEGQFGNGTRTDEGFVFRNNRLDTDHAIIAVIPAKIFKKL
jgi:hypothetical protein